MSTSFCSLLLFSVLSTFTFSTATGMGFPDDDQMLHVQFFSVNLTMATVAGLGKNSTGFAAYGNIEVVHSVLTEVPDPQSKPIGEIQALGFGTSPFEPALLTFDNFVLSDGKYKGSSIAVYGRVVIGVPPERSIIGGTGVFQVARGYMKSRVIVSTPTNTIEQFDFHILLHKH